MPLWAANVCRMDERRPSAPLGKSRRVVYKLATLFSLDAFAGGFVVQSLLTLWLFKRFDMSLSAHYLRQAYFFLDEHPERIFLSSRGVAFKTVWSGQHNGFYPYSVQRLPDCCSTLAEFDARSHVVTDEGRTFANGCSHAHVLRYGCGHAR